MSRLRKPRARNHGGAWERIWNCMAGTKQHAPVCYKPRRLVLDQLEERTLLSVTAGGTTDQLINQALLNFRAKRRRRSIRQLLPAMLAGKSVASDNNGDFVVVWSQNDGAQPEAEATTTSMPATIPRRYTGQSAGRRHEFPTAIRRQRDPGANHQRRHCAVRVRHQQQQRYYGNVHADVCRSQLPAAIQFSESYNTRPKTPATSRARWSPWAIAPASRPCRTSPVQGVDADHYLHLFRQQFGRLDPTAVQCDSDPRRAHLPIARTGQQRHHLRVGRQPVPLQQRPLHAVCHSGGQRANAGYRGYRFRR